MTKIYDALLGGIGTSTLVGFGTLALVGMPLGTVPFLVGAVLIALGLFVVAPSDEELPDTSTIV